MVHELYDYLVDRSQRWILLADLMRKRGNQYIQHSECGQPPVLIFDYDLILDGRTFERPVNFAIVAIMDRRDRIRASQNGNQPNTIRDVDHRQVAQTYNKRTIKLDPHPARPIVIIDPRSGQGPGLAGTKLDSQIGVALNFGHPVYFVMFYTEPEPGQTYSDVQQAIVKFIEEVELRHSHAPKPAIIGNSQGGWAAALIAADRPDLTGPIVLNGSPLSFWSGVQGGVDVIRYKGGLCGGSWLASLACDLGSGLFDGAHFVAGYETLDPADIFWSKWYNLFRNIDTDESNYLNSEKWWGGFFKMNAEEIHFIVNSLFLGNELENGHLRLDDGRLIDLKNLHNPILVFASQGDNITPPSQALNWIHKMYGTVGEIKRSGQTIIYMIHEKVEHLGLFVSGRVAKKEHNAIIGSMRRLEYIGPGLYEMVTDEEPNAAGLDDYDVRFEEREMEDILQLGDIVEDEKPFMAVNGISRFNDAAYRALVSPWVRAAINEKVSENIRQLHPLRMQRYLVSDQNLFCWPLKWMGESVVQERKVVDRDNPFVLWEKIFSNNVKSSLDYYRDVRDLSQEMLFKALYDTPLMGSIFGENGGQTAAKENHSDLKQLTKSSREKARLRKDAVTGGFV